MSLHDDIMNISIIREDMLGVEGLFPNTAYKFGHRDARHAAAEMAIAYDQKIEELEKVIKGYRSLAMQTLKVDV